MRVLLTFSLVISVSVMEDLKTNLTVKRDHTTRFLYMPGSGNAFKDY